MPNTLRTEDKVEIKKSIENALEQLELLRSQSENNGIAHRLLGHEKEHLHVLLNHIDSQQQVSQASFIKSEIQIVLSRFATIEDVLSQSRVVVEQRQKLDKLRRKNDSLKSLLDQERNDQKLRGQIAILTSQIEKLERQLTEAQKQNAELVNRNTSLAEEYKAVEESLNKALSETNKWKDIALEDAELATGLTLWYFENDRKEGKRRRLLTNDEQDENISKDINTIHGLLTLSAQIYKPYKVATIKLLDSDGEAISQCKISIRKQKSSEFTLLCPNLEAGKHRVSAEYDNQTVINQEFYVVK